MAVCAPGGEEGDPTHGVEGQRELTDVTENTRFAHMTCRHEYLPRLGAFNPILQGPISQNESQDLSTVML